MVDLGCWLGGSSIALAQGLPNAAPNDATTEKVISFDRFVWETWMPAHVPYCVYRPGESFLPEARRLTQDRAPNKVELIAADLRTYRWTGGPIKILVIDAMKNEELTRGVAHNFFTSLQRGGLLIHQDFKHFYTSWLHLLHYQLRDHFRFHENVPKSGTTAFEVVEPVSAEQITRATEFRQLSDEEVDRSFRHSMEIVGDDGGENIAAAHVMHYLHLGRKRHAFDMRQRYAQFPTRADNEFAKALSHLA